jgi:spermidine/putrescine transport system substrate-binding protein
VIDFARALLAYYQNAIITYLIAYANNNTRRKKMKKNIVSFAVLAALILPVIISCDKREKLYLYNWSYYTPDSVIEKFEKEFNVKVIYDEFASNEEMYAKLKATSGRSTYDIVFPSKDFVPIMKEQGLLEEIDKSKLQNLGNIDLEILHLASYDPEMEYSVPYFYGAGGIIVNTARVPDFEKSWSIFGRTDLKGRMTMLDDLREVLGAALAFQGFSVNSRDIDEINAARDIVNNSWKPNLVKFDSENFGKSYANGEFWVVHGFPETVYEEIADNEQLLADTIFFIPDEGGPSYIDSMCILKGARNIELAHKFIDFIHRPKIYAEFADDFGLPATVNVPARDLKTNFSMYDVEELQVTELVEDVGLALEYYTDAWFNSIRAGF